MTKDLTEVKDDEFVAEALADTDVDRQPNEPVELAKIEETERKVEAVPAGGLEYHGDYMGLELMEKYARVFVASQMFPDLKSASQGMVKIMAGQELGMSPFNSIKNINIIQGKPELSAGALSALVKSSGRYDYKVKEWDDKHCVLEWYDLKVWGKEPIGTSSFTEEEAKAANLASKDNWRKFAKAMYFARALSQGVRTYAPDATSGAVYITGEISGEPKQEPLTFDPKSKDLDEKPF